MLQIKNIKKNNLHIFIKFNPANNLFIDINYQKQN